MRPFTTLARARIHGAIAHGEGLAVATGAGIELFDRTLAPAGRLDGPGHSSLFAAGDRFVTFDDRALHVGTIGGALAAVELGHPWLRTVVPTARGFLAITRDERVLTGEATTEAKGYADHGGVAFEGGAVIAGTDGVAIVDGTGEIRARVAMSAAAAPCVCGERILVPRRYDSIAVLDRELREIGHIDERVRNDALAAFARGVLVRSDDAARVSYWSLAGEPQVVWTHASIAMLCEPIVVGERAVLRTFDGPTHLFDADRLVATLPLTGYVRHVAEFGHGIALAVDGQPGVTWWRPSDVVSLPHDVEVDAVVACSAGLASIEDRAIYLWRTDADGPELGAPVACEYPLGEPLVIAGQRLVVEAAGRYRIRARAPSGKPVAVPPGRSWRAQLDAAAARTLVGRLVARDFGPVDGAPEAFADRVPAELVDLHGRALVAPASLSTELQQLARTTREAFLDELGAPLGMSARVLRASIKARTARLVPPRPADGYDYLGTFTTSGAVVVSDPCHLGKSARLPGLSLAHALTVADGIWHVFVRDADDRTAELAVVHDRGLAVHAAEPVTSIGVDAGCVGVFDRACPKLDLDRGIEEGVVFGLGAVAYSGHGDGMYPLFAGSVGGTIVKLRVSFIDDTPEIDRLVAKPAAAAKPYSIRTTYAVGEAIEHPKFGTGVVTRLVGGDKLDVRFPDGNRTLVHAKT